MAVPEFNSGEDFERWLADKPTAFAQALAVRAALRVWPMIASYGVENLTLLCGRALLVADSANIHLPTETIAFFATNVVQTAASILVNVDKDIRVAPASSAVLAARNAAVAAISAANTAAGGSSARIFEGAGATFVKAKAAADEIDADVTNAALAALAADAGLLTDNEPPEFLPQALMARALWPNGMPKAMQKNWMSMKAQLRIWGHDWDIWEDWYEQRLSGSDYAFARLPVAQDQATFSILTADNAFWARSPALVNADIKARLDAEKARLPTLPTGSNSPRNEEDEGAKLEGIGDIKVPDQLPGPLMTFERQGRIARQPLSSQLQIAALEHRQSRGSARTAIVEALDDFDTNFPSHNHSALARALVRLRAALGQTAADIDVVRLGIASERIKEYASRADDIFVAEMAAEVVALNTNLGRNLRQFEEWRAYVDGLAVDPAPSDEAVEAAQQFIAAMVRADALEPEVVAEIQAEIEPLTMPLEGESGTTVERKTFMRSVRNILVTVCSSVINLATKIGGAYGEGALEGVKALGKSTILVGVWGGVTYVAILATTHSSFSFLAPFMRILEKIADKALGG